MTTTVHVSRTFHVDPEKNPQVLEELRLLAARGFEVLGPLDLTPVESVAAEDERKSRFVELMAELKARQRLSDADVASLLGVSPWAVSSWKRKTDGRSPREKSIQAMERLASRAAALPEGSTTLRDEARGARAERARRGGPRPLLSVDQKIAIGVMREAGSPLKKIASAFGVSAATVCRVVAELGGETK